MFLPTNVRGIPCVKLHGPRVQFRLWTPEHAYNTQCVQRLVESLDASQDLRHGCISLGPAENLERVVCFGNSTGLSVHSEENGGRLKYLWLLGAPTTPPDNIRKCFESHSAQNWWMTPKDGIQVQFDVDGNVRRFWQVRDG